MTEASVQYPFFKGWKNNLPLVGGKVYTYVTGTDTPINTYSDIAQTVANTNPVILDSVGEAPIFYTGTIKIVLKDADDVLVWTMDGVSQDNYWLWHKVVYGWPGVVYGDFVYGGLVYP